MYYTYCIRNIARGLISLIILTSIYKPLNDCFLTMQIYVRGYSYCANYNGYYMYSMATSWFVLKP